MFLQCSGNVAPDAGILTDRESQMMEFRIRASTVRTGEM